MKVLLPQLILLLTSITLNAQTITWQKVYGEAGEDVGHSIAQVFDGGYVMCGYTAPPFETRVIRTDKFGNVVWNISSGGLPFHKILQTNDSNFILVGFSWEAGSSSRQGFVVKTDARGNLIWRKEYGNPNRWDVFNDALMTNDGSLMIVGSFGPAIYLIELDSSGNKLWDRTYESAGAGSKIHEIEGKGYLLTGSTALYVDYEGNVKYSSPNLGIDGVPSASGNRFLFLAGDLRVIVTDTTLNEVSRFWITMPGKSLYGNEIIAYGENYVVAGESITNDINADEDAYLVKFDISGNVIWNGNIPPRFQYNECINEVFISSDSGFIAAGVTSHFIGTTDFLAIKTDRMGNTVPVSILESGANELLSYRLFQNYPNPFNPVTTITYDLPNSGFVTLKVYDMLGREVKILVKEFKTAGYHKAQFTAEGLASGAYFYRLSVSGEAGEFTAVRKCVVVK